MSISPNASALSMRSMEILTPEPPKKIEIGLDSDEENVDRKLSRAKRPSKNKQKSDFKGSPDKNITIGLEVIKENESTISELMIKERQIRAETERIREENAEMFRQYRYKLGNKGGNIVDQLYSKIIYKTDDDSAPIDSTDYLYKIDDIPNHFRDTKSEVSEEYSEISFNLDDRELKSKNTFFRTQADGDEETQPDDGEYIEEFEPVRDIYTPRGVGSYAEETNENESQSSFDSEGQRRKRKNKNFVQRNIELAWCADGITDDDAARIEGILNSDDESNQDGIEIDEGTVTFFEDHDRLTEIDSILLSNYSNSLTNLNKPIKSTDSKILQITDFHDDELNEEMSKVDSQLTHFRPFPPDQTRSESNILSICGPEEKGHRNRIDMVSYETIRQLIDEATIELDRDSDDENENDDISIKPIQKISYAKIKDLVSCARFELDLEESGGIPKEEN